MPGLIVRVPILAQPLAGSLGAVGGLTNSGKTVQSLTSVVGQQRLRILGIDASNFQEILTLEALGLVGGFDFRVTGVSAYQSIVGQTGNGECACRVSNTNAKEIVVTSRDGSVAQIFIDISWACLAYVN